MKTASEKACQVVPAWLLVNVSKTQLRWRMFEFLRTCREQWLPRLRPPGTPEQRWILKFLKWRRYLLNYNFFRKRWLQQKSFGTRVLPCAWWLFDAILIKIMIDLIIKGDRSRGWAQGQQSFETRCWSHHWQSCRSSGSCFGIQTQTDTNVRINICIENCTNIRIYSNIRLVFTL